MGWGKTRGPERGQKDLGGGGRDPERRYNRPYDQVILSSDFLFCVQSTRPLSSIFTKAGSPGGPYPVTGPAPPHAAGVQPCAPGPHSTGSGPVLSLQNPRFQPSDL